MHLFLYGVFRHFHDKNIGQSAMTLIAECHTRRFFKLIPERSIPQLREWRGEALRENDDLSMGRSAILFLTPDAT
jgi:hypothetical protein